MITVEIENISGDDRLNGIYQFAVLVNGRMIDDGVVVHDRRLPWYALLRQVCDAADRERHPREDVGYSPWCHANTKSFDITACLSTASEIGIKS